MHDSTNPPNPDATIVVARLELDVTVALRELAQQVVRGLVAHAAYEDLAGRPAASRISGRTCPSCGEIFWIEPEAPGETLCATCQTHGDLRRSERGS